MRGIWIGLALALVAAPAWAQTQQQHDWCYSPTATDDQTIDGCTALIGSGRQTTVGQAAAYDARAYAYLNKGLYDQVIADETQSLALNPNSANTYNNRGRAYDDKGLYDQAIADYTHSIALKPDTAGAYNNNGNAFAYSNRGDAYRHRGLYDQAIADYSQSIALRADFTQAYTGRAAAYENKGQRDQAVADYRAGLKIDPNLKLSLDGLTRLGATP
jgi:tetratricopeptide (TPR) repeat protein